jgi:hypothetical protein
MQLTAYRIHTVPGFELVPADATRPWMDDTSNRFAYRCLPLTIANQMGWVVPCPVTFDVVWSGREAAGSLHFNWHTPPGAFQSYATDHFGHGIVTFSMPWIFRTDPGYGLLVSGPTNLCLPNAHPLDGFVETDWVEATFTMNWRLLEPGVPARFARGTPLCQIMPYPKALLQGVSPREVDLASDPELAAGYAAWSASRTNFNHDPARKPEDWQKDYFLGKTQAGEKASEHLTRLNVKAFERG